MSLEWFNMRDAAELGSELADQLTAQSQSRARGRNATAESTDQAVQACLHRANGKLHSLRLNFLKRAKLAHAFKWRLLESGIDKQRAAEMTHLLVLQLSLADRSGAASTRTVAPRPDPQRPSAPEDRAARGSIKQWMARGDACVARGEYEQALALFQQAAQTKPRSAEAHNNVGAMLFRLQRCPESESSLRRALELRPAFPEALCTLAMALQWQGYFAESEGLLRRALKLQPRNADARAALGKALSQQGRAAEAAAQFQAVLRSSPSHVEGLIGQAQMSAITGRFADAEAEYRRVLELPGISAATRATVLAAMPSLRRMDTADTAWLEQAQQLAGSGLATLEESGLRFALGKYLDDIGASERAFEQYRRANQLSKQLALPYSPSSRSEFIDRQIRVYSRAAVAAVAGVASDSSLPVFVIGMPRSGTSLVEQIIASHPAAAGAGELTFWMEARRRNDATLRQRLLELPTRRRLATEYLQRLRKHSATAARIVDKAPANSNFVGLIHSVFPKARFIHMRRDPIDTCLSCYFQPFGLALNFAMDLSDLEHYYREHHRLMQHWRAVLPSGSMLEVPYEELVADQAGWTRRIIDFIGLEWNERCLHFHATERHVTTPSAWQVRQKIYQSSVGRWRRYEEFIGPLKSLQKLRD